LEDALRLLKLLLPLAVLMAMPGIGLAEKRVALVLAAGDYVHLRPLRNPRSDAALIEVTLDGLGFDVTVETDRDLRRMRRALDNFAEDAEGADLALVYFAGHGIEVGGRNRLLPVDADGSSLARLEETSLPLDDLRSTAAASARALIVILDACRNDPFGGAADASGRGAAPLAGDVAELVRPGLGRIGRAENTLFAFSAAPGETAADGEGGNSPFAAALARHLGQDGLEIRSVLTLVQQEVYDATSGRQLPYVESGLPQLFFASMSGKLPEREALLLAMASVTPDLRAEVERVAAASDMPLAPLYGALITADLKTMSAADRDRKLAEAAGAYTRTRAELRTLASEDPDVARLRDEAQESMALGAFESAQAKLAEAARIDAASSEALAGKLVARRVSEAASYQAAGGVALARLDYAAAISSFEQAARLHERIETEPVPDADRRTRSWLLAGLGDLHVRTGATQQALDAYRRMEASARRRLDLAPGSDDAIRDLAISKVRVADALRLQGERVQALAALQQALELRGGQRARMDGNADWISGISGISERIADIRRQNQDYDGALSYYDSTLVFRRWLVEHYGTVFEYRDGLVSILGRIGAIRYDRGEMTAVREAWKERLDVARRLAADFPDNPAASARVMEALISMGDLALAERSFADARAAYEESEARARAEIARDGHLADARYKLAQSLRAKGVALFRLGERPAAHAAFGESLTIMQRLAALDPSNVQWRLYEARILSGIGSAYFDSAEYAAGLEWLQRAAAALRILAESDAADRDSRTALLTAVLEIGRVKRMQDDISGAREAYAEVLSRGRALDLANSPDDVLRESYTAALNNNAVMAEMQGDRAQASADVTELLAMRRADLQADPDGGARGGVLSLLVRLARLSDDPAPHLQAALNLSQEMRASGSLGQFDATPEQVRSWIEALP
jgi:uncharacterized caspase-like protein